MTCVACVRHASQCVALAPIGGATRDTPGEGCVAATRDTGSRTRNAGASLDTGEAYSLTRIERTERSSFIRCRHFGGLSIRRPLGNSARILTSAARTRRQNTSARPGKPRGGWHHRAQNGRHGAVASLLGPGGSGATFTRQRGACRHQPALRGRAEWSAAPLRQARRGSNSCAQAPRLRVFGGLNDE